jgi:hypothetical protein
MPAAPLVRHRLITTAYCCVLRASEERARSLRLEPTTLARSAGSLLTILSRDVVEACQCGLRFSTVNLNNQILIKV